MSQLLIHHIMRGLLLLWPRGARLAALSAQYETVRVIFAIVNRTSRPVRHGVSALLVLSGGQQLGRILDPVLRRSYASNGIL